MGSKEIQLGLVVLATAAAFAGEPIPRSTNVVVAPRAPESRTATFSYRRFTNALAFSASPPLLPSALPHAAR